MAEVRGKDLDPAEAAVQSVESGGGLDMSPLAALRLLMESRLPGEILNEEESEIDLMIQLSGMVQDGTGSSE